MIHLKRYFAALTVLLVLYCSYALAVAPWLEPPPIARAAPAPGDSPTTSVVSPELKLELTQLFPPDHWVHRNPKILETEQCTLLIQEYQPLPDGRLELKPCTLIFRSADSAAAGEGASPRRGRPIVLEAPKAELAFDRPLNLARGEFGRVEKGTLSGEVNIYGPPTVPGGRDELRVRTRAVWLDRQSIRTSNDVEFQYGDSVGRGRDLEITLLQDTRDATRAAKSKLGAVQSIVLKHIYFLRIATQGRGILGDAAGPKNKNAATVSAPLEVSCQGEFAFDMPAQLARFQERVEVRQIVEGGPPDVLRCDELLLAFAREKASGDPPGAEADPLAGRLARIIAIGRPAVLEAPSRGVQATAAFMEYSLADRSMTLKSDQEKQVSQVSLRQLEQHFIAPELHYQMAEQGRLGRLHATGPGELRLLQGRGSAQQIVTARWQRELQIQPQNRDHVISLLDAASVTIDPLGRFDGNELHLWVVEAPVQDGFGNQLRNDAFQGDKPQPQLASDPLAASELAAPKSKTTIIPLRLLAVGNVRLVSPQLDADTSRLEAWFINLPAEPPPDLPPPGPPARIREPVQPVAYTPEMPPHGMIRDVIRPPNVQKFHVGGGMIRMQLLVRGRQYDLEDLNIEQRAQIDEIRTPEPGQEPIRIRGDLLEVRRGTQPQATVEITGQPAEVAGRGMSLAGGKIQVRRGENRLWIDGPGEATMPAGEPDVGIQGPGARSHGPGSNMQGSSQQKMHLVWQQGMTFDGLTARFDSDVRVRTATQTAQATALEATLSRRIDFQTMTGQPQAQLARVFLDGGAAGVYLEGRSFDEFGEQLSAEQLKARNLMVDRLAGTLQAAGPGWVNIVRRGSAGLPGAPGSQQLAPPSGPMNPTEPQPLSCVHVEFERELVGDITNRWIEFRQHVETTYSPAHDFGDVIVADPLGQLGPRQVLMKSERLRITETTNSPLRTFEMEASGRTEIDAENLYVESPVVRYASDKEVLSIEGDGRAQARIFRKQGAGQQYGSAEGERFRYNLRSGELQTDSVKNIRFPLPPNIKLPNLAPPDPTKPTTKRPSRGAPP